MSRYENILTLIIIKLQYKIYIGAYNFSSNLANIEVYFIFYRIRK